MLMMGDVSGNLILVTVFTLLQHITTITFTLAPLIAPFMPSAKLANWPGSSTLEGAFLALLSSLTASSTSAPGTASSTHSMRKLVKRYGPLLQKIVLCLLLHLPTTPYFLVLMIKISMLSTPPQEKCAGK